MSETPNEHHGIPGATGWTKKKIGPVPLVYIVAAATIMLVLLAYQSYKHKKANPTTPASTNTTGVPAGTAAPTGGLDLGTPPAIVGTVSSNPMGQNTPTPTTGNSSISTNDQWKSAAVSYLIQQGATAGDAQLAIQDYFNGGSLSYAEGQMRDAAVKQFGVPPASFDIGPTAPKGAPPVPAPSNPYATDQSIRALRTDTAGGGRIQGLFASGWQTLNEYEYSTIAAQHPDLVKGMQTINVTSVIQYNGAIYGLDPANGQWFHYSQAQFNASGGHRGPVTIITDKAKLPAALQSIVP